MKAEEKEEESQSDDSIKTGRGLGEKVVETKKLKRKWKSPNLMIL